MATPQGVMGQDPLGLSQMLSALMQQAGPSQEDQTQATSSEVELQALLQQLSAEAGQAQGQVAPARQAYQDAAGAPMQGQTPADVMQSLFANIGTAVGGGPGIAEGARQNQAAERQQRAMTREQHLQSLHDEYVEKAKIATEMKQTDVAMQMQVKASKAQAALLTVKQHELKQKELAARFAEIGAKYEADKRLEELRGKNNLADANARKGGVLGYHPDTSLIMPQFADSQITARSRGLNSKKPEGRLAAMISADEIRFQRRHGETKREAIARLVGYRQPLTDQGEKATEPIYAITGKPVYKMVTPQGGNWMTQKVKVKDEEAELENDKAVIDMVNAWFAGDNAK